MKYNYTKATKEHITQMAVRKQFIDLFDLKFAALKTDLTNIAKDIGDHKELAKLPCYLHSNFHSNSSVSNYGNKIITINQWVALQSREYIRRIELDCKVFADNSALITLLDGRVILEFQKFVDEIDDFANDVKSALNSYTTYKKAVESMPWIEDFHPDHDKSPACKIVPVETINKVNEIMKSK